VALGYAWFDESIAVVHQIGGKRAGHRRRTRGSAEIPRAAGP